MLAPGSRPDQRLGAGDMVVGWCSDDEECAMMLLGDAGTRGSGDRRSAERQGGRRRAIVGKAADGDR